MMMRLNSEWVERTLAQYPARLVPDSDPVVPKLIDMFGDHTFFLDNNGLNIVEPAETFRDGVQAGRVVELAHWTDARPPKLVPHEPEPTDLVIELETIG
ncbi:MAG: hypothetical protein JO137_11490 [Hyphomicrobiales bacterium]|nr:hypothetical protein [Hyphomicrobiales bacterium]MBV9739300.1 hypothetical protein [Hyphomicrobiales bacterium]